MVLLLSCHVGMLLPSNFFRSGFQTKNLYEIVICSHFVIDTLLVLPYFHLDGKFGEDKNSAFLCKICVFRLPVTCSVVSQMFSSELPFQTPSNYRGQETKFHTHIK